MSTATSVGPLLTPAQLSAAISHLYPRYDAVTKGRSLLQEGSVQLVGFTGQQANYLVADGKQSHQVNIMAASAAQVIVACSCRSVTSGWACAHVMAAVWHLAEHLQRRLEGDWRYRVEVALAATPPYKPAKAQRVNRAVVLAGLRITKSGLAYTGQTYLYQVPETAWRRVREIADSAEPAQAALQVLDEDAAWKPLLQPYTFNTKVEVVNLAFEAQQFLELLRGNVRSSYGYYSSYQPIEIPFAHLSLIFRLNLPIFLMERERPTARLEVREEPLTLQAALVEEGETEVLEAGVRLGDEVFRLDDRRVKLLVQEQKAWILVKNVLAPVANANALQMLNLFPLRIPAAESEEFRTRYFQLLNQRMPLVGDRVRWEVVQAKPVPRLYLTKNGDAPLRAELRFGYGDYEVKAHPRPPREENITLPGQWGGVRVVRDTDAEFAVINLLTDARYGLKRAGPSEPGVYEIRARTHPLDFLVKCIPALTEAGFEIYGDKNIAKVNRHRPTVTLNITSGIDWFDVQALVHYGDQTVSLKEVYKALRRGDRYIKLADGSVGQLPEEWLERYRHLFALAEETADGLRVKDLQVSLLDELLAEAETRNIAPEFHAKRERLKGFAGIAEQPLPAGFTGELRPYQKAGYDWLHFLHEYGFGGILADDMGLGKTIQALAFLQSLKERGQLPRPALLVVPKSLLVNWQREAARFAPELRVLEFMGNFRKKDYARFDQADLVITTYGTMLRDIEFLQGYRFAYAILDESQAVKNPLAKSSKAVRLLQADHRLCLTGTPVENNTFELWSQFAFLNPGLLGSLEYFKDHFASDIERRDEAAQPAAQLLRRLTYPFILRRTKEQVAPELPPRTERVIYIDLEPAQRKLYHQTRDYYRGLLLGLLEQQQEINDIRFKILEGLLRMRQVCIHPQLVEPTYHGPSAKFEIVLETLETLQAEGHKALVFSQFVQSLALLRREMDARHMAYAYLDGQTQNRQAQVDRFQQDPTVPFFLISLKAGGLGLNLTAADYVLHLDPWWNPAVEMQASDRAHRIGQEKPVFIYKFIARDTVEEKILQLQARKRELVEQLIAEEGSFFKSLTSEDIKVLFS
ncbi:MAG: SNF2-related protein [Anaerolineae bacterium]|nr:SNF2-related protein [Anaerolineae bacterium]